MRLAADLHTHTVMSGHAFGTIREMAAAAAEKGLEAIGFTEHGPGIPGTCELIYLSNLPAAPKRLYGVDILYGCEANVLNDGTLSLKKYTDPPYLDYVIAGIHRQCYEDAGRQANTDNLISCMAHPRVFFVSHPDDDHTPLDYPRLVRAAKEHHVALELNNSSLTKPDKRWGCFENYRELLPLCMEERCPIIVSSDAHDPDWVARFGEALALLEEIGFDEELVLNTSVAKVREWLAEGPRAQGPGPRR